MKNLSIKLNQDYKSFENGFDFSFNGDLIIISGVNGSGKSQLMDIIRQQQPQDSNQKIIANIELDGNKIENDNVVFRSFKESFNLSEIHQIGISKVGETKSQVWNYYNQGKLFSAQPDILEAYKKSLVKSREILINTFGEKKFNSKSISQENLMNANFGDFLWQPDDPFSNVVGDMFFAYANKIKNEILKYGKKEESFKLEKFGEDPPWIKLNKLFEDLKLEYRFENKKSSYFLKEDDAQLNKSPQIYPLLGNGNIDENNPRKLSDLSDGEKAIILLIFASFNNKAYEHKKILLLDEFDATFNPSLIEAFYKVVEKYFISKGVLVMIVTHSPVTISLAPKHASFYEVFSKIKTKKRILPVQRNEYKEIQIANKNFYKKITDHELRIKTLESAEKEYKKINLYVEDTYAQIYKIAYLKLHGIACDENNFESFFEENSSFVIHPMKSAKELNKTLGIVSITDRNDKKVLGLFDFDSAYSEFNGLKSSMWGEILGDEAIGLYRKRTNYFKAMLLPVPKFREIYASKKLGDRSLLEVELLFEDKILQKLNCLKDSQIAGTQDTVKKFSGNKKIFWKKLFALNKEDFIHFQPLFDRIEELFKD